MQIASGLNMSTIPIASGLNMPTIPIASGLDIKAFSHKYYKECRFPVESGTQIIPKDWSSIFISSLPAGFDNNDKLSHLIEVVLNLGSIKRIDYAKHSTTNKPIAFIHFHYWNNTPEVQKFRYDMEHLEYLDVSGIHTFFTSAIAANLYNHGNTDSYAGLDKYFEGVPNSTFLRMMINKTPIQDTVLNIHQIAANAEELNKKVIQLTETLESVVNENKLLKEQMETIIQIILPKPALNRSSDDLCPSLSLDDLVTVDDVEDDVVSQLSADDLESEHSYPAFHPYEFSEHFSEDTENKLILDTAIIVKDYDTIVNYFLKYEKCAQDEPCLKCVFDEFCDDNNIESDLKDIIHAMLVEQNKNMEHTHEETCEEGLASNDAQNEENEENMVLFGNLKASQENMDAFWKFKNSLVRELFSASISTTSFNERRTCNHNA